MSNNNAANRAPLAPINLYDPIQQHSPVQQPSPVVPHLHTSSGDKYALPSPKLGRANKHADNATPVNKVRMHSCVYCSNVHIHKKSYVCISQPNGYLAGITAKLMLYLL